MAQQTQIAAVGDYYFSPENFTAAFSSTDTLDITGLPTALAGVSIEQFIDVTVFDPSSSLSRQYLNGQHKFVWTPTSSTAGTLQVVNAAFTSGCTFRVGIMAPKTGSSTSAPITVVAGEHPVNDAYTESGVASGTTNTYYVDVDQVGTSALVSLNVTAGGATIDCTRSPESGSSPSGFTYAAFGFTPTATTGPFEFVYNVSSLGPTGTLKIEVTATAAGTDYALTIRGV